MRWLSKFRQMARREPTVTVVIDEVGAVECRRAAGPYDHIVGVYTSAVTDGQLIEDMQAAVAALPRNARRYVRARIERRARA